MQIRINTDGVPIYIQIANQVKYLVASGRLSPGDELPAIRVLAEQLLINPNTVARAYRELELAGIVITKHGSGTIIADTGFPLKKKEMLKILSDHADVFLSEAKQMNISIEELIKLLEERNREIENKS